MFPKVTLISPRCLISLFTQCDLFRTSRTLSVWFLSLRDCYRLRYLLPYLTYSILLYLPLHYNEIKLGSPSWARTSDTVINSHVLYQLSYQGIVTWLHLLDSNQPSPVNSRAYSPRILRWNCFGVLQRFNSAYHLLYCYRDFLLS